jgi:hypothetical protein
MPDIALANTSAQLSGKTVLTAESDWTVSGLITFSRGVSAPFAVAAGAAKVSNLDADKLDGKDESAFAEIAATETISAVWTFSAKPNVNAGLQFPATQAASSDDNTLDDYEEGSWSPTYQGTSGSGVTYTTQSARYVKIGKHVHITGRLTVSGVGTASGNASIASLPFTIENVTSAGFTGTLHIGFWSNLATPLVYLAGIGINGTTRMDFYGAAAAGAALGQQTIASLGAIDIIFSGSYLASA